MPDALKVILAKQVLADDMNVRFGIFGVIDSSSYFPPMSFLNEFLMVGYDPCDQDERMARWSPMSLSLEEYSAVKKWWISNHPDAQEDSLGVNSWHDWIQIVLNM